MAEMAVNPYESPREAGYRPAVDERLRDWIRDRIALVVTAIIIQTILLGGIFLYAWLTNKSR
jgi:hypothetical protein